MKKIFSNKYIRYTLLVIGGIFLGWLFFHSPQKAEEKHDHGTETAQNEVWTCSMHPQIRMDKPGKCPLCAMDLIPVSSSGASMDPDVIHFTKEAAALANVMTSVVTTQKPVKEIRLYGKIQADERLLQSQVAHIPGRIEKLQVNFTGEEVKRGQPLATIYSPELVTAQQELIEAAKAKAIQPEIYEAVKEKLRQWKLPENQISAIESSGNVKYNFDVYSTSSGIVTARRVNNGDYISQGTVLYEIADLSKVWVLFDAYESDLPFLSEGNKITFAVQAIPGKEFTGNITFIDPVIDPVSRVSKVRVEINNQGKLKPEMFVTGTVSANLSEYRNQFIIPRSAVLWTGKRSIVYVKQAGSDDPVFKIREIEIGPLLGSSYVVLSGLAEGEEIVTHGAFSVDAAAQLEGKPSMMNQEGNTAAIANSQDGVKPLTVGKDFKLQLTKVFEQYVPLKNAFVLTDAKKVTAAAKSLQQSLSKVNMELLSGEAHDSWMDISGKLNSQLKKIQSSSNIADQRNAFIEFNNQFYKAVKTLGLSGKTVYHQYCPMANNDKGAYWLSEEEPIRNPYFGDEMLTCGEVKETLRF
jgi:Cu(I)/Ag(I) efflux system membrane fusion protein